MTDELSSQSFFLMFVGVEKKPWLPLIISTGFGSGFSPIAPGTAGALLATLLWLVAHDVLSYWMVIGLTIGAIIVFTVAGIWSANRMEKYWGKDPSKVVVDEMVGVWIALLAVPDTVAWPWYALGAFVLFRLLDIFKPLGIRRMERFKGGVGVMMDDILAGVYGFIILMGIRWWIG